MMPWIKKNRLVDQTQELRRSRRRGPLDSTEHASRANSKLFIKSRFARRGIYWLPNLFTIMALFAGFYAIVQAMGGRYEQAAMAIFVAMVLDGMDGRVARLTHTQSAFGAELDSLSDMVSFGVAPALVVYHWALQDFACLEKRGDARAVALDQARLDRRVRLLRVRGAAARALQHQHRCRRQALLPGTAEPGRGVPGRGPGVGDGAVRGRRRRTCAGSRGASRCSPGSRW